MTFQEGSWKNKFGPWKVLEKRFQFSVRTLKPIRPYSNLSTLAIFRFVKQHQGRFLFFTSDLERESSKSSKICQVQNIQNLRALVCLMSLRVQFREKLFVKTAQTMGFQVWRENDMVEIILIMLNHPCQVLDMNLSCLMTVPLTPEWKSQKVWALFWVFTLPVNFLLNRWLATSFVRSWIMQIFFSQLFGTLKGNLHALVKYQVQPMFLLCQVLPTWIIPCGHVVNNLRTFLDVYFRTLLEDKSHSEICKQFPKPDALVLALKELGHWLGKMNSWPVAMGAEPPADHA